MVSTRLSFSWSGFSFLGRRWSSCNNISFFIFGLLRAWPMPRHRYILHSSNEWEEKKEKGSAHGLGNYARNLYRLAPWRTVPSFSLSNKSYLSNRYPAIELVLSHGILLWYCTILIRKHRTGVSNTEAMPPKPKDPFTVALERFKNNLTGAEISQFNFTTFDDLWAEVMKIQREQNARRSLQNLARIGPFIDGLKKYSAVIDTLVSAKPELMAFIWVVQLLAKILKTIYWSKLYRGQSNSCCR